MPIKRALDTTGGFLTSAELALLQHVFVKTSVAGESEAKREARASRILANFQAGITNEAELISLSRQQLGR
jgi:hypothetical protein